LRWLGSSRLPGKEVFGHHSQADKRAKYAAYRRQIDIRCMRRPRGGNLVSVGAQRRQVDGVECEAALLRPAEERACPRAVQLTRAWAKPRIVGERTVRRDGFLTRGGDDSRNAARRCFGQLRAHALALRLEVWPVVTLRLEVWPVGAHHLFAT